MGSIGRHHRPQVGWHVLDEEVRCCRNPGYSFANDAKNHRNAWSNHDPLILCNPNQLLLQSNANSCHMSTWCKCPFHIPKRLQHHICNIKSITNPSGELPPRKERKTITYIQYIFWKVTSYPLKTSVQKGSFPLKELGSFDFPGFRQGTPAIWWSLLGSSQWCPGEFSRGGSGNPGVYLTGVRIP